MLARRAHLMMAPKVRVQEAILKQRRFAPVLGQLMTPIALVGYVLALWRLGADLNWLDEFFIHNGLFSRWQVWLAIDNATQLAANQLNRVGNRNDRVAS
jgi:hypothetical protein